MDKNIKMLDFHLFDGAGAGGAGGTGAGSGSGGDGGQGDASASDNGASTQAEPTVIYGIGDDGQGYDGGSQVGSDDNSAGGEDLEAEFAAMIGKGGRFQQIYGQKVAQTVGERFKNQEDLQGKLNTYDDALAPLYAKYGLKPGDMEGMARAIAGDDDIYATRAEAEGMTVDKYKEQLRLQQEAERGRTMFEEFQRQQAQKAQFEKWDQEAAELTQTIPGFNLQEELKNQNFIDALNRGNSMQDAFAIVHMQEILSGAIDVTAQQTQKQVVDTMKQKAARPVENGMRQSAAIVRKTDPSKLTDKDMEEIDRRVANGEVIRFG